MEGLGYQLIAANEPAASEARSILVLTELRLVTRWSVPPRDCSVFSSPGLAAFNYSDYLTCAVHVWLLVCAGTLQPRHAAWPLLQRSADTSW